MLQELEHIIVHTLEHSLPLVPFLFLTYLAMEYLEHRAGDKVVKLVHKAGKAGPLVGGIAGAVPQCGFSAAASNLYAGKIISPGTLIAIFLSTSDEMLPLMISDKQPVGLILQLVLIKVVIGMIAGFVVDFVISKRPKKCKHEHEEDHVHDHIHEICEHDHCNCEKSILRSAIMHTLQITFFILLITFALELVLEFVGEDTLAQLILNRPVLGPVLAGLVGLIPNCAASVVVTELYLSGALSMGAMMSGLLTGSGVGLLVLFRVNHDKKANLGILGILYLIGVVSGIVIEFVI